MNRSRAHTHTHTHTTMHVAGGFWTTFSCLMCGCLFNNGGIHSVPSVKERERERRIQSCELVCVCMCMKLGMCFLLGLDCTAMDVINVL